MAPDRQTDFRENIFACGAAIMKHVNEPDPYEV